MKGEATSTVIIRVRRSERDNAISLPELPYSHDALTPYMSRETLEYHHDKHHKLTWTMAQAAAGQRVEGKSVEEVVKGSFGKNAGLFNNAGQHYNHILLEMDETGRRGDKIPGALEKKLTEDSAPSRK